MMNPIEPHDGRAEGERPFTRDDRFGGRCRSSSRTEANVDLRGRVRGKGIKP